MVASAENTAAYALVTAKEITQPKDLKGHSVAISTFGGSSEIVIRYTLEKLGLDSRKDVTLLQVGGQSTRFAALQSGRVKATIVVPPFTITAKKQGFNILAEVADMGFEYQGNGVALTGAFLKSNPETVRNFLKAYIAGIHFMKTQKEETLKIIAKYMKMEDREALDETYRVFATQIAPKKPYPTLKGFQAILDEVAETNPKAKQAKPEQFVDTRLLREIDQSGFIDALYR
jgi:ABC-type nitrate/sulfonate/bicarbonate transport system substrate-binding protein